MKKLRVLIACEESQTECLAFRQFGCEAYSCDLQPCSGGHPEWHIQGDCLDAFHPGMMTTQAGTQLCTGEWDLIISHPPCTYLSKASPDNSPERIEAGYRAAEFFFACLDAPAKYVAVENPIPKARFGLPRPDFACNPYDFGEPWSKKTLFWLRNLPPLMYTYTGDKRVKSWVHCTRGSKKRSKAFASIANAMAEQWTYFIRNDHNIHASQIQKEQSKKA